MPPATKRIIPDLTGDSPGFTGPSAETNIDLATPKLGGLRSQSYTRPLLTGVPSTQLSHPLSTRACSEAWWQFFLFSPFLQLFQGQGFIPGAVLARKKLNHQIHGNMPKNAEFNADPCGAALNIPKHSYLADMELACVGLRLLWCLRCRTHHPCLDSNATLWKNVSSFNLAIWSVFVHLSFDKYKL